MRTLPWLVAALALAAPACGASERGAEEPEENEEGDGGDSGSGWIDPSHGIPEPKQPSATLADATDNPDAPVVVIEGGTVLTATGEEFSPGTVILEDGAIEYVGDPVDTPEADVVIDADGRYVTPGLIDTHSHIGVYAEPSVDAHHDGNEMTGPSTPEVRARYGDWPQDPSIPRARAGGVTTALVLPGSANLVGGRGFTAIMRPGASADDVAFPGAPPTLKMACGENPKRVYGEKGGPQTRMAEYAQFRQLFHEAAEYRAGWRTYRKERAAWELERKRASRGDDDVEARKAPAAPARDLGMDTLARVLDGEVLVQIHCYRAAEIRALVAVSDELGFPIRAFHHALGAYKVRDELIDRDISISTWADWWGFKMEAFDGIEENAALFEAAGGRPVIHSDSAIGIQRLNQEAAKAMYAGRRAGVDVDASDALRWITANAAWTLGIEEVTGTLEEGKRADVVVWNRDPMSVYALADVVIQGGEIAYERDDGRRPTDFELENAAEEESR